MKSRILLVEDDPGVREVVEEALSREGMETVAAESGEDELERLRLSEPFDMVVLDLMLPGRSMATRCAADVRYELLGRFPTHIRWFWIPGAQVRVPPQPRHEVLCVACPDIPSPPAHRDVRRAHNFRRKDVGSAPVDGHEAAAGSRD